MSTNPYSQTDYQYFEDVWANTLAGEALDTLIDFVFGGGLKPVPELIHPNNMDDSQKSEELKKYSEIIDHLIEIDKKPNINTNENAKNAALLAKVFGRSLIAFESANNSIAGVDVFKVFHPRDLGRVFIKSSDWTVSSVSVNIFQKQKDNIKAEEMIYFVNKKNNPIQRNIGYGFSDYQRIVGGARSLRRFVEFDSPEIVQSMWASYGMIISKQQTKSPKNDAADILAGLKPGGFNVIIANPEDVAYHEIKLTAEVEKMTELMNFFERLIIGNFKVPGPLLGREEESNMATLLGKIRLFMSGPVKITRDWVAGILEPQWYNRILQELYPEAAKVIRIKCEFEPLIIESWIDIVDSLSKLTKDVLPELPIDARLKITGLEQFKDDIEKNKKNAEQQQAEQKPIQNTSENQN